MKKIYTAFSLLMLSTIVTPIFGMEAPSPWTSYSLSQPLATSNPLEIVKDLSDRIQQQGINEDEKKATALSLITFITTGALQTAQTKNPLVFGVESDHTKRTQDQYKTMIDAITAAAGVDATLEGVIQYFITNKIDHGADEGHMNGVLHCFKQAVAAQSASLTPASAPGMAGKTAPAGGAPGDLQSQIKQKAKLKQASADTIIYDANNSDEFIDQLGKLLGDHTDDWEKDEVTARLKAFIEYKKLLAKGDLSAQMASETTKKDKNNPIREISQEIFLILDSIIVIQNEGKQQKAVIKKGALAEYMQNKSANDAKATAKQAADAKKLEINKAVISLHTAIKDAVLKAYNDQCAAYDAECRRKQEEEEKQKQAAEAKRIADEQAAWEAQPMAQKIEDLQAASLDQGLNLFSGKTSATDMSGTIQLTPYILGGPNGFKKSSAALTEKMNIKNLDAAKHPKVVEYYNHILSNFLGATDKTYYSVTKNNITMVVLKLQSPSSQETHFVMVYADTLEGEGKTNKAVDIGHVKKLFGEFVDALKTEAKPSGKVNKGIFQ